MPYVPEVHDDDLHAAVERDWFADRRHQLKELLDAIASEVTSALKDAGFKFPIFLTVPSLGETLLTFATPLDPSHQDWQKATQMVCSIVGAKIGLEGLRSREVPCVASGIAMSAADLSPACGPLSTP